MSEKPMNKIVVDNFTEGVLATARKTYGNKNQILVCMEELNELACALAKYPRYEDEHKATMELYDKVLDEVADVTVILKHVCAIFNITDDALDARINKKTTRLLRWLMKSESMQETIDDRAIEEKEEEKPKTLCDGCNRNGKEITYEEYMEHCMPCYMAQATDGTAPHHS